MISAVRMNEERLFGAKASLRPQSTKGVRCYDGDPLEDTFDAPYGSSRSRDRQEI